MSKTMVDIIDEYKQKCEENERKNRMNEAMIITKYFEAVKCYCRTHSCSSCIFHEENRKCSKDRPTQEQYNSFMKREG